MQRRQHLFFALLAVVHLISTLWSFPWGIWITKPLLLPTLAAIYYLQVPRPLRGFDRLILVALLASCAGDIWLMLGRESFFLFGLGSFLIAHLFYIAAFLRAPGRSPGIRQGWPALILILYAILFVSYLWADLDPTLSIPVGIYALVIGIMGGAAFLFRYKMGPSTGGILVVMGALLFIASDSLIALNKFKPDLALWQPRFLIMLTYIAGQWLICEGVIRVRKVAAAFR